MRYSARAPGRRRFGSVGQAERSSPFTTFHDVVTVLDADGTIRAVSAPFTRVVGGDAHQPVHSSVFTFVHPEDHDTVRTTLERLAKEGGTVGPLRFRLRCADGSWFDGAATMTQVTGDPSLDGAVLVSARDTSVARPAHNALVHEPANDSLAQALREALEGGQFRLVYQPKVALATNRIVGVEALLRWEHPDRGPVAPAQFIAVAEATGLIVPIGAWVLREACGQCAEWQRSFPRPTPLSVAVNASARQFRGGLVDAVRAAIAESGIDASGVCLEVTESTVMQDVDHAIAILGELKSMGLTLSIDDFGTGYSSLEYLRRLPLDEVKIDRSFVQGLATDPEDTAIVAAVISLAHALDRDVVAEGVETHEQLDRLRSLGCEMAQGFLLARPMAPESITELLTGDLAGERVLGDGPGLSSTAPGTETVLVADDAGDVRQLARMSLTAAGFEVEEVADGAGALAAAHRVQPRCVVLDVGMPDMSGIEVCQRLRADPATAGCTIVMLTTHDEATDKAAAFSAGADEYIVKPFAPRDLVSRVRTALGRRADAVASVAPGPEGR